MGEKEERIEGQIKEGIEGRTRGKDIEWDREYCRRKRENEDRQRNRGWERGKDRERYRGQNIGRDRWKNRKTERIE